MNTALQRSAQSIVDKLIEDGPLEPGEFLSDFPTKRAQSSDFTAVVAKLNQLRAQHGGWSDEGDTTVVTWGGDPIERYDPSWLNDQHFRKIIDFESAVVDENGDVIPPGIAQENPLDTFYGWQGYLDFTDDDGPVTFKVEFGTNSVETGSFEENIPPEALEVCQKHWEEFKAKFIDPVLWLVTEARGITRAQWKKQLDASPPEVQAADQLYKEFMGGVEPGKKISSAGALAAYTFDWPEYDHWINYGGKDLKGNEHRTFYGNPNDQWKQYYQGVVYYEGRSIYVKGKGSYNWKAEWSYGSSYNFTPHLQVDIEFWDKDRIWKSHWKKPVLWDYKRDRTNSRGGTMAEWDEASPELFDTIDLDQAIKDRLVKSAKAFVERLSQVAEIGRVRWNVPELYVKESTDDMLGQMGDVASKNRYVELLTLFCKTFKRHGGDTGPEIDEACWRPVIVQLGLGEIPWRATEIMDAGYDLLRGDLELEDAWSDAVVGLVDDRKIAVSDEDYNAVKRLWHFRYQDEDAFIQYAMSITEAKKPSTKGFEQIGGDFGNPWDYGGTWFSPQTNDLIHFPGIDDDEKDVESSDPRIDSMLTPGEYASIANELHMDNTDKWENTEDDIRSEYATKLTDARKFRFYRTSVDGGEWIEKDWAKEIAEIKQEQELDDATWAALPDAQKEASIADRIGWEEFDHYPQKITRFELSMLLGIDL